LRAELNRSSQENSGALEALQRLSSEVQSLSSRLHTHQSDVEQLQSQNSALSTENTSLTAQLQKQEDVFQQELQRYQTTFRDARESLESQILNQEIRALDAEEKTKNISEANQAMEQELLLVKTESSQREANNLQLRSKCNLLQEQLSEVITELQGLIERHQLLQNEYTELARLKEEHERLMKDLPRITELEKSFAATEARYHSVQSQLVASIDECEVLQSQLSQERSLRLQVDSELSALRRQISELRENTAEIEDLRAKNESLQSLLQKSRTQLV
jgi:DNA repair exonuclease SbcCD ATPase subunit